MLEAVPLVGPILAKVIAIPLLWLISLPAPAAKGVVQAFICASCGQGG